MTLYERFLKFRAVCVRASLCEIYSPLTGCSSVSCGWLRCKPTSLLWRGNVAYSPSDWGDLAVWQWPNRQHDANPMARCQRMVMCFATSTRTWCGKSTRVGLPLATTRTPLVANAHDINERLRCAVTYLLLTCTERRSCSNGRSHRSVGHPRYGLYMPYTEHLFIR